MEISKNLAKWAYAWNYALDRKPYYHPHPAKWDERNQCYPENIGLCPLFWRTFAVTPALILSGLFVAAAALTGLRDFIVPITVTAGLIGSAFGLAWLLSKIVPAGLVSSVGNGIYAAASYVNPVFDGVRKAKKTMCPFFSVKN